MYSRQSLAPRSVEQTAGSQEEQKEQLKSYKPQHGEIITANFGLSSHGKEDLCLLGAAAPAVCPPCCSKTKSLAQVSLVIRRAVIWTRTSALSQGWFCSAEAQDRRGGFSLPWLQLCRAPKHNENAWIHTAGIGHSPEVGCAQPPRVQTSPSLRVQHQVRLAAFASSPAELLFCLLFWPLLHFPSNTWLQELVHLIFHFETLCSTSY